MLSQALKEIRLFHKLKQNILADKLGISTSYLSEIESNKKKVTVDILEKYSNVFSIPVSSLMMFSENIDNKYKGEIVRRYCAKKIIELMEWFNDKEDQRKNKHKK